MRATSSESCSRRIAVGCVVSRTWKLLDVERAAQDLRREARAAHAEQDDACSYVDRVETRRARRALEHPAAARRASRATAPRPCPVQTVGSRAQIRSTSSCRRRLRRESASSPRLARSPSSSSVERVGELLDALRSSVARDVVVVDADRGRARSKTLLRLVESLRRASARPRRGPGRPGSSPRASCSRSRGRSAPRRTGRRGTPGSWSRWTPTGSAAGRALRLERLPALAGEDSR